MRLPGAGGAPEIAASCGEVIVIVRQSPRAFVEQVDFVTSVGYGAGPGDRERLGLPGRGPVKVITDLGVLEPDPETCELTLTALHEGVTAEQARAATGWELRSRPTSRRPRPSRPTALRELASARADTALAGAGGVGCAGVGNGVRCRARGSARATELSTAHAQRWKFRLRRFHSRPSNPPPSSTPLPRPRPRRHRRLPTRDASGRGPARRAPGTARGRRRAG